MRPVLGAEGSLGGRPAAERKTARRKPASAAVFVTAAALLSAALSGCRTLAPAPPVTLPDYLPANAEAYLYVDVTRAREPARRVLEQADMEGRHLERILRRTERVAVALGANDAAGRVGDGGTGNAEVDGAPDAADTLETDSHRGAAGGFLIAASGRFAGFVVEAQLEDEPEWSRRRVTAGAKRYAVWAREADGLELAFPERRVALLGGSGVDTGGDLVDADGDADADTETDGTEHEGMGRVEAALHAAAEARRRSAGRTEGPTGAETAGSHAAVLALPYTELRPPFGGRPLAVHDLELRGNPRDPGGDGESPQWIVGGRMRFDEERTARAVTALVRIFAVSALGDTGADPAEVLADLDVEREGTEIVFGGIMLAERYLLEALDDFTAAPARGAARQGAARRGAEQ
ncbi:MAG: hypothetical protein ACLFUM_04070 [Spirochaetaceae bacterium]